jgi:hypothetical protein
VVAVVVGLPQPARTATGTLPDAPFGLPTCTAVGRVTRLPSPARAQVAGSVHLQKSVQPPNEALQQTRSALTSIAAALAAERRCSADTQAGEQR